MKTSLSSLRLALGTLLVGTLSACPEVPPADVLEPAPVITSFTASATQVAPGTSIKLTWSVENAVDVRIDDVKLGAVSGVSGNSGEVDVAVTEDTLYVLSVRNRRGASDSAVIAVRTTALEGELLFTASSGLVSGSEPVTLAWSAPGATTVTITADPGGDVALGGQLTSGSVVVRPTAGTTYTLSANGRTATARVEVRPTLLSFQSDTGDSVDAGTSFTLTWTTAGASRVQLSAPGRGDLVDSTTPATVANGTYTEMVPAQVDPGQLYAYRLTVSSGGVSVTRDLVVSIAGNPGVVSFAAPDLARNVDGGTMTLSWQTRETETLSLAVEGVEFYRAPTAALALNGTLEVPVPENDVTYTLTARGARGGVVTATQQVDVVRQPTVTLTASPTTTTAAAPFNLSWTGQHVRRVSIIDSARGLVHFATGSLDTGNVTLRASSDATYTIIADNSFGDTATATANLTVTNPISLTVSDTGALRKGQDVGVSWTSPETPTAIVGLPHGTVTVRASSMGFDDIETTGAKLTFPGSGNIVATIDTPFRTVFFGHVVGEKITVSRYGYLVFADAASVNGANSTDEALPSAKLEPWSIAPYWDFHSTGDGVFWQVKQIDGQPVLIVQWSMSSSTFQAKIAQSGQIDFEYSDLPTTVSGRVGVVGSGIRQTIAGPTPAVGRGLTFFGPQATNAQVRALAEGPVAGTLQFDGGWVPVFGTIPTVIERDQLLIAEAMRASTAGVNGQWVELQNFRDTPVELAGWNFPLLDGGAIALSGTVPARGLLVVGASTDPALNDDAGVQVALPNFDLTGINTLNLSRAGAALNSLSLVDAGVGVAMVNDVGPYALETEATPATRCLATATYGGSGQRGTPGASSNCGFPYALSSLSPGYFDISDAGTRILTNPALDDEVVSVDLASAPVPFLGTPRTSMQVSSNGFIGFDSAIVDPFDQFAVEFPELDNANSVAVIFADDIMGNAQIPGAQLYVLRVGANQDPFAAAPHWIVQWHHFATFTSSTTGLRDDLNFQIKLFDDGVIEYHYGRMVSHTSSATAAGDDASSWLEDATGARALVVNAVSTNAPGISPFSAYRFTPR